MTLLLELSRGGEGQGDPAEISKIRTDPSLVPGRNHQRRQLGLLQLNALGPHPVAQRVHRAISFPAPAIRVVRGGVTDYGLTGPFILRARLPPASELAPDSFPSTLPLRCLSLPVGSSKPSNPTRRASDGDFPAHRDDPFVAAGATERRNVGNGSDAVPCRKAVAPSRLFVGICQGQSLAGSLANTKACSISPSDARVGRHAASIRGSVILPIPSDGLPP